jgi:hypothetical protein
MNIRDQIADIIYQTKGATLGHYKAADQIVELIGLNPFGVPWAEFIPTHNGRQYFEPEPEHPLLKRPSPVFKSSRGAS